MLEAVPPSPTWGRATPGDRGPLVTDDDDDDDDGDDDDDDDNNNNNNGT